MKSRLFALAALIVLIIVTLALSCAPQDGEASESPASESPASAPPDPSSMLAALPDRFAALVPDLSPECFFSDASWQNLAGRFTQTDSAETVSVYLFHDINSDAEPRYLAFFETADGVKLLEFAQNNPLSLDSILVLDLTADGLDEVIVKQLDLATVGSAQSLSLYILSGNPPEVLFASFEFGYTATVDADMTAAITNSHTQAATTVDLTDFGCLPDTAGSCEFDFLPTQRIEVLAYETRYDLACYGEIWLRYDADGTYIKEPIAKITTHITYNSVTGSFGVSNVKLTPLSPSMYSDGSRIVTNLSLLTADEVHDAVYFGDDNWGLVTYNPDTQIYGMVRSGDDYGLSMYPGYKYSYGSLTANDGNLEALFYQYDDTTSSTEYARITMTNRDFLFEEIDEQYSPYNALPNGVTVYTPGWPDNGLYLIDKSGKSTMIFEGNSGEEDFEATSGYGFVFALDDTRFAYHHGGWEWTFGWGVYDTATGENTYFPSGEYNANGTNYPVKLIDGKIYTRYSLMGPTVNLEIYDAATLQKLDVPDGILAALAPRNEYTYPELVEFSPSGTKLAVLWENGEWESLSYELFVYDLSTGAETDHIFIPHEDIPCSVSEITFIHDFLLFINGDRWFERDYYAILQTIN